MTFVLDDLDVSGFADRWLAWVEGPDAKGRSTLLRRQPASFAMGSAFMMANIAPQAAVADSTDEELILYAVLAAFQNAGFPGQTGPWPEARTHLELAFAHARQLGRSGVARNLLRDVAAASRRTPDELDKQLLAKSLGGDASKLAEHDAEMASIRNRDVRAAALLDPTISLDELLLE
ncbi:hypothetical protein [Microbacterium paraoxydans]|uniref:hypothetical protein n=1 Tax=Microbacterium paraoxydans TaxID=199592 RepID=UPI0004684ACD|nr:hypothetical protein [Microbacterium paraoxydans]